jgi:hypothetical protein
VGATTRGEGGAEVVVGRPWLCVSLDVRGRNVVCVREGRDLHAFLVAPGYGVTNLDDPMLSINDGTIVSSPTEFEWARVKEPEPFLCCDAAANQSIALPPVRPSTLRPASALVRSIATSIVHSHRRSVKHAHRHVLLLQFTGLPGTRRHVRPERR